MTHVRVARADQHSVTEHSSACQAALRVSDVVPLRHVLGSHSIVLRIDKRGEVAPLERMPALFFSGAIRDMLDGGLSDEFQELCRDTAATCRPATFRSSRDRGDEVLVYPVLSDDGDECQFLICWARSAPAFAGRDQPRAWSELRTDRLVTRYRRRSFSNATAPDGSAVNGAVGDGPAVNGPVVDVATWWLPSPGELIELSAHYDHVAAMGMAHIVLQTLLLDAFADAAAHPLGPALRVSIPSAELLAGSVPIFHGALSATGIDPSRVVAAVPVELAVDHDLLPIIVHLRTMGACIDIVGLDSLTATLHLVSDTAGPSPHVRHRTEPILGRWVDSYSEAATVAPTAVDDAVSEASTAGSA